MSWQHNLRRRLADPPPGPPAQLRFAPQPRLGRWHPADTPADARRAAALILLYPGPEGPTLVLTERRADLLHHPGQISLPGGRLDPGETPEAAAVREAQEEVGVPPDAVEVVGTLSTLWVIVSRFVVHPVVAIAEARPALTASPGEVAAIHEIALARLQDPGAVRWGRRTRGGLDVCCPYFVIDGPPVWGATAMILGEFLTCLDPGFSPPPAPDPATLDLLPTLG